jgi:hypothetical protein
MKSSPPILSVSTIIHGTFYEYGKPLPFQSVNDPEFPKHLKRYVIKPQKESDSAQPQERNLAFSLHTSYGVDERGYRYLKREAAELAHQAIEQELIEEAIQTPLPDEIAQQIQDQHQANVNRQIAELQFKAKQRDQTAAQEWIDSENSSDPNDEVQPIEQEEMPKPKPQMRKRFVRRGKTWLRAIKISVRPGESVFVRNGPNDFQKIGVVNSDGSLPVAYLEE